MIGREDMDECPKCHNTGLVFQRLQAPTSVTSTAKWCDCPLAKRYIASLRQLGQSQAVLKGKIAIIQRNIVERMAQLAADWVSAVVGRS
jgi:hypothetical protein